MIVTLTTDFGSRDHYVGQVKGALLSYSDALSIVDLCHGVPPGQTVAAAYLLETGHRPFPPGSVHLAVVDPGVGTDRRGLVAEVHGHLFVAPDNGLLTRVLRRSGSARVHAIDEGRFGAAERSATFDGRDLFAPVAARLATGEGLERFGPAVTDPLMLEFPEPPTALVLWVDQFGNVVLDVPSDQAKGVEVETSWGTIGRHVRTFAEAPPGEPALAINSSGYLEIVCDGASAAAKLELRPGAVVRLRRPGRVL